MRVCARPNSVCRFPPRLRLRLKVLAGRGLQLLREWQEQKLYASIQLFNRYCKPFGPSNIGTSSAQDGKNPHLSNRNLDTQS